MLFSYATGLRVTSSYLQARLYADRTMRNFAPDRLFEKRSFPIPPLCTQTPKSISAIFFYAVFSTGLVAYIIIIIAFGPRRIIVVDGGRAESGNLGETEPDTMQHVAQWTTNCY